MSSNYIIPPKIHRQSPPPASHPTIRRKSTLDLQVQTSIVKLHHARRPQSINFIERGPLPFNSKTTLNRKLQHGPHDPGRTSSTSSPTSLFALCTRFDAIVLRSCFETPTLNYLGESRGGWQHSEHLTPLTSISSRNLLRSQSSNPLQTALGQCWCPASQGGRMTTGTLKAIHSSALRSTPLPMVEIPASHPQRTILPSGNAPLVLGKHTSQPEKCTAASTLSRVKPRSVTLSPVVTTTATSPPQLLAVSPTYRRRDLQSYPAFSTQSGRTTCSNPPISFIVNRAHPKLTGSLLRSCPLSQFQMLLPVLRHWRHYNLFLPSSTSPTTNASQHGHQETSRRDLDHRLLERHLPDRKLQPDLDTNTLSNSTRPFDSNTTSTDTATNAHTDKYDCRILQRRQGAQQFRAQLPVKTRIRHPRPRQSTSTLAVSAPQDSTPTATSTRHPPDSTRKLDINHSIQQGSTTTATTSRQDTTRFANSSQDGKKDSATIFKTFSNRTQQIYAKQDPSNFSSATDLQSVTDRDLLSNLDSKPTAYPTSSSSSNDATILQYAQQPDIDNILKVLLCFLSSSVKSRP
ncbi:hypothetical protein BKA70DRAFT_1219645 [Coprinopsis sp. MPI-PUGE-AT-0042]|nr:hypothetical protein BKA70DRAFT_1219645 [Coprinopsis sp. MPI-PUGE-AT-0042]